MTPDNLVEHVLSHDNRKKILAGLMNGTCRWFYGAISQIHPNMTEEMARQKLRVSLESYLLRLHRIYRGAGLTKEPYDKFYHENERSTEAAMFYLLKTLHTTCGKLYLSSVIALWIDLEHKEEEYKSYACMCTGEESEAPIVTPYLLYNFLGYSAEMDEEKSAQTLQ